MNKVMWSLLLVVVFAATAMAGQGDWEYVDGVPSAISSGYLGVSALDQTTMFAIGINQFSANGAQWAWRSTDAGETMDVIFQFEGTGDDCDMVGFFTFMLDADWYDIDHGVVVGMAVPEECIEEFPEFPQCMFACMFRMRSFVWTVSDGGDTFVRRDAGGNMTKIFIDLKIINETIFAGGSNGMFRKSTDFGETWVNLPSPETGTYSSVNDMWWLNENVGFVATAAPSTGAEAKEDDSQEQYEAMKQYLDYYTNPIERMKLVEQGYVPSDHAGKAEYGNLYKTIDGGHNWEKVYDGDGVNSIFKVQFLNEMVGIALTDEWDSAWAENTIQVTHDGGATWVKGDLPEAGPNQSKYIVADVRMLTPDLGYAAAAYQAGFAAGSLMLFTTDGGATWAFDAIGSAPGYTGNPAGYGFIAMDFAGNSRGYGVGMNLSVARYSGTNAAPVADAGEDFSVDADTVATLDGSGSSDPDGDSLLYHWTQVDGPEIVTLADDYTAAASFTATAGGEFTFELEVSDVEFVDTDEVIVTVIGDGTDDDDDDADDDAADDDVTDDDAVDDDATDDDATDDDATDDDTGEPGDDDDDDSGCGC